MLADFRQIGFVGCSSVRRYVLLVDAITEASAMKFFGDLGAI